MKNKKIIGLMALTLVAAMILTGCGKTEEPAPNPSTPDVSNPGTTDQPSGETTMQTNNSDKKIVDIGTFEGTVEGPIVITSIGQSADVSMLDALMKKVEGSPEYTFNATATADDIADAKTIIICSGASSKGLGAAGISADDEKARATALLEAADASEATIIVCHLGGSARRGELSDQFSDMALAYADYIIVVEEGNADGKFTTFAADKGIPVTLVNAIADTLQPLNALFAA